MEGYGGLADPFGLGRIAAKSMQLARCCSPVIRAFIHPKYVRWLADHPLLLAFWTKSIISVFYLWFKVIIAWALFYIFYHVVSFRFSEYLPSKRNNSLLPVRCFQVLASKSLLAGHSF